MTTRGKNSFSPMDETQTMQNGLKQARRMEAVGAIAGSLAHDFNNVLTVIRAHIDLLSLDTNTPEQTRKIMGNLNKAVDQGSCLTKELLIFGRKTDTEPTFLNVADRVRETSSLLREALPKNVALILQLEESLPPIFINAGHLDRILMNLVMNASDAMPNGGTITISTEDTDLTPLTSRFDQDDEVPRLCLKISDTGHGIDAAARLRVFEPFYSTKANGKGIGLGLSVVFNLVQIHSGSINLRSEVGRGTTVSLFFPLYPGSDLASEGSHQSPSKSTASEVFSPSS